jgi:hypothetical protein
MIVPEDEHLDDAVKDADDSTFQVGMKIAEGIRQDMQSFGRRRKMSPHANHEDKSQRHDHDQAHERGHDDDDHDDDHDSDKKAKKDKKQTSKAKTKEKATTRSTLGRRRSDCRSSSQMVFLVEDSENLQRSPKRSLIPRTQTLTLKTPDSEMPFHVCMLDARLAAQVAFASCTALQLA